MSAKELLNLTHTAGPITGQPAPRRVGENWRDSLEGVLIFCGIGLAVTGLAAAFRWLELPPPYF